MPKKIILISSSALKLTACDLKFKLTVLDGWKYRANANDIELGSAFHVCAKVTAETGNFGLGCNAAVKYWRDTQKNIKPKKEYMDEVYLQKLCIGWYNNMWTKEDSFKIVRTDEDKPIVEKKFCIPCYVADDIEILLAGTIDKLCIHRTSKILAIGDYKTTSMWDSREYFRGYKLSGQILFYTLCLKKEIERSEEGSFLSQFKGQRIHSFIDGIFCKGADKEIEFSRSEVMQESEERLNEYNIVLNLFIEEVVENARRDTFYSTGILNGACETKYGKCNFFDYCAAGDSVAREHILNRNFISKPFNPLDYNA